MVDIRFSFPGTTTKPAQSTIKTLASSRCLQTVRTDAIEGATARCAGYDTTNPGARQSPQRTLVIYYSGLYAPGATTFLLVRSFREGVARESA